SICSLFVLRLHSSSMFSLLPCSTLFPYTTLFRSRFHPPPALGDPTGGWLAGVAAGPAGPGPAAEHRLLSALAPGGNPGHRHARQIGRGTRLNSSHVKISYAVFCLKKKTN